MELTKGAKLKAAMIELLNSNNAMIRRNQIVTDPSTRHWCTPNGTIIGGASPAHGQAFFQKQPGVNLDIQYQQISGASYVCVFNSNKYSTYPDETRNDDYEGRGLIPVLYGDSLRWMDPVKYQISADSLSSPLYIFAVMHGLQATSDPTPKIVFSRSSYLLYSGGPYPSIVLLARVRIRDGQFEVYHYVDRHSPIIISRRQWTGIWMPTLYFTGSSMILEELQEYARVTSGGYLIGMDGNLSKCGLYFNQRITSNYTLVLKFNKKNSSLPVVELANGSSNSEDAYSLPICQFFLYGNPFVTAMTNEQLPGFLYDIRDMQSLDKRVETLEDQ